MSEVLNKVPAELIEEILLYVPEEQIPDLMLLCKKVNEVVSESSKLMKNFELQYKDSSELNKLLAKSIRRYRRLNVTGPIRRTLPLSNFFTRNAFSLQSVSFYECDFSRADLHAMLSQVGANLTDINLCEVSIGEMDEEVDDEELPRITMAKLKSMELMYDSQGGYDFIFSKLATPALRRFTYEDEHKMNAEQAERFVAFMTSQTVLEDLSLSSNATKNLLKDKQAIASYPFRLRNFYLWMDKMRAHGTDKLMAFLNTQQGSLKVLTLCRVFLRKDDVSSLLQFDLEDFRLVQCRFDELRPIEFSIKPNRSIKSMFISSSSFEATEQQLALKNILESCKGLTYIKFACIAFNFEICLALAYGVPSLDRLQFYRCTFPPITFPSVEHITFFDCERQDVVFLIRVNRQLKSVFVPENYQAHQDFQQALQEVRAMEVDYNQDEEE